MDEYEDHHSYGDYEAQNLRGFPAQMHSYNEAGCPPTGMEMVPILPVQKGAISTPEQLQGILCLKEPPESFDTATVAESEEDGEAFEGQDVCVFLIRYRDFTVLKERATVRDGPFVMLFGSRVESKTVTALRPSAYPPRFLSHAQTCDAANCRHSPREPLKENTLAPSSPRVGQYPTTPVVGTPELLELVLLNLDMKTRLVSASRVCKFWHATIKESPRIQRASFFQPEKPFESPEEKPELNPLLVEVFGDKFFDVGPEKPPARRAESFWKLPWAPSALTKLKAPTGSILSVEPSCRQESFTRAGASWRRMLVSQPPPPFLGFMWLDDNPREPRRRLRIDSLSRVQKNPSSSSPAGVTMGQLYDTIQLFIMEQLYSGLFYRVHWDKICERQIERNPDIKETSDSAIERTNLVVDFWDDDYYLSSYYGPFKMDATRSVFACEESCRPMFGGKAKIKDLDLASVRDVRLKAVEFWGPLTYEEEDF